MNINWPNVDYRENSKVSSDFLRKMWLIEYRIVTKYQDFHHYGRWFHHHNSRGFHVRFSSSAMNSLQLWPLNSSCFKSHCFLKDSSLFKGIVYTTKQVFIRSSYYCYCEKPICMRCTVTQLARESVGPCPLSWFIRERIRVITQYSSKEDYKNNSHR